MSIKRLMREALYFVGQVRLGFPRQSRERRRFYRLAPLMSLELRSATPAEVFEAAMSVAIDSDELVELYGSLLARCGRREKGMSVQEAVRLVRG